MWREDVDKLKTDTEIDIAVYYNGLDFLEGLLQQSVI